MDIEIKEEFVTVYLLDSLNLLIGEDCGKVIKNAVRVLRMPQGPALTPLFADISENKNFGTDVRKKDLKIIMERAPEMQIVTAYIEMVTGEHERTKIYTPGPRDARYYGSRN